MAGALGLEQTLGDRHRLGRGHADRLVEDHPAMDVALVAADLPLMLALAAVAVLALRARIVVAAMTLLTGFMMTVIAMLHGRRQGRIAIARVIEA
jgi:hypothetical protein